MIKIQPFNNLTENGKLRHVIVEAAVKLEENQYIKETGLDSFENSTRFELRTQAIAELNSRHLDAFIPKHLEVIKQLKNEPSIVLAKVNENREYREIAVENFRKMLELNEVLHETSIALVNNIPLANAFMALNRDMQIDSQHRYLKYLLTVDKNVLRETRNLINAGRFNIENFTTSDVFNTIVSQLRAWIYGLRMADIETLFLYLSNLDNFPTSFRIFLPFFFAIVGRSLSASSLIPLARKLNFVALIEKTFGNKLLDKGLGGYIILLTRKVSTKIVLFSTTHMTPQVSALSMKVKGIMSLTLTSSCFLLCYNQNPVVDPISQGLSNFVNWFAFNLGALAGRFGLNLGVIVGKPFASFCMGWGQQFKPFLENFRKK